MAYVSPNFKSKKALKEALTSGQLVDVFQPGLGTVPHDGTVTLEGPYERHSWYAVGVMKDGRLVKVR
jgi:hypothetical protein